MRNLRCEEDSDSEEAKAQRTKHQYSYSFEIDYVLTHNVQSSLASRFKLPRLFRALATLLKLNLIEALVFKWLLRKLGWKYSEVVLAEIAGIWGSILPGKHDSEDWRKLQVLMLLAGWRAKEILAYQSGALFVLEEKLARRFVNFRSFSRSWQRKSGAGQLTLTSSEINKLFSEESPTHQSRCETNYNKMVDQILELSHAYNTGPAKQQSPPKEERRTMMLRSRRGGEDRPSLLKSRAGSQMFQSYFEPMFTSVVEVAEEGKNNLYEEYLLESRHPRRAQREQKRLEFKEINSESGEL